MISHLRLFLTKYRNVTFALVIALSFFIATLLPGFICIKDYTHVNASNDFIDMSISIMLTLILGGCLILLIENRHIQGDITSRYSSAMRPFYSKLTHLTRFVYKCILCISGDKEGREFKKELKSRSTAITKYAYISIMSGRNIPFLNGQELESLCDEINGIWYFFDRNYEMYSHLKINDDFLIEDIRKSLIDYDREFSNTKIDLQLLPKVVGEFYTKVWQPIQDVPYYYESFMKKSKLYNNINIVSLLFEIACLLVVYICAEINILTLFLTVLLTIMPIAAFIVSLLTFNSIKRSRYIMNL